MVGCHPLPEMPGLVSVLGGDHQVPAVLTSTSALPLVVSPEPVILLGSQNGYFVIISFFPHVLVGILL